jgi:hypothetical protein
METVFKVGDRVFCILHGWGTVRRIFETGTFPILVFFTNSDGETASFTLDGRYFLESKPTLSFTEYTLQGFSQERPIELPEVGELCLVRDHDDNIWNVRVFIRYIAGTEYPYMIQLIGGDGNKTAGFKQMKRIKILD